jgi:hypothetical protein
MMIRIKRIGVLSFAKIVGLLYAVLGLIFGMLFTLFSLIGALTSAFATRSGGVSFVGMYETLFGIGSIILFPIMYGVMGFITGLIMAAMYNFIARWIGGIEVETE